ncbi:hypothetical protein M902_2737 [Bacteriovorax sp. BAL6_X]|nr:hypothetical protein M902_2737 [Bacteriovorax sp. BAL6_X]
MKNNWVSGIYRVKSMDGVSIYLVNVETKEKLEISSMDRGWEDVSCY